MIRLSSRTPAWHAGVPVGRWRLLEDREPRCIEAEYEGADSLDLLKRVSERLKEGAWKIGNIDVTIIAERPKLGPHIPEMRRRIAEAAGTAAERISIKAKTGEGLDAVGREEAIAAHAVALVHRRVLAEDF